MDRKGVKRQGVDISFESGESRIKRAREDERQQGASKEVDFYNSDVEEAALVQDTTPIRKESQADMLSNAEKIFEELLSQLHQQTTLEETCLFNIREALGRDVAEPVEEFLLSAKRYLENKRKAVFELVSEINGALQGIAEIDKMREDTKETMTAAWNALA
ncbi:uncharacterized protein [Dermacentor andersoni]|uniref:uncharacterized protein n=1 Tax=Dermacentor andersoni TaxID=34620 RepID=UPI003B3AF7A3